MTQQNGMACLQLLRLLLLENEYVLANMKIYMLITSAAAMCSWSNIFTIYLFLTPTHGL